MAVWFPTFLLTIIPSFKCRMWFHLQYLHFKSFPMVWRMLYLNKVHSLHFCPKVLEHFKIPTSQSGNQSWILGVLLFHSFILKGLFYFLTHFLFTLSWLWLWTQGSNHNSWPPPCCNMLEQGFLLCVLFWHIYQSCLMKLCLSN